jgi:hypothetical protein
MSEPTKVPVIRQDAQIPVVVGTGIIKRLQELAMSIIVEKTEEDIDRLESQLKQNITTFDEPWMNNYYTVMLLLNGIETKAIELGLVDNLDAEDVMTSQQDS